MFTTSRDKQTSMDIVVLQGESDRADENEKLGNFELAGLRSGPAGAVAVEVTFAINADGIASVAAKDVESGLEQSISVTATSGLTKGEMASMVDAGRRYERERSANEELERKKQEVESLLVQMDKLFISRLASLEVAAIEAARGAAARALEAMDRQDLPALKVACADLAEKVARLKVPAGSR